jgi:hypothetical protein
MVSFSDQNYQFGYILEGLGMENAYIPIYSGHMEYFTTHWVYFTDILAILVVIWYILTTLWYIVPRKIWQPCFTSYSAIFFCVGQRDSSPYFSATGRSIASTKKTLSSSPHLIAR